MARILDFPVVAPAKILEMIDDLSGPVYHGVNCVDAEAFVKAGKRMPVGTVADWGGTKYRKVAEGQWSPLGAGKEKGAERPGGGSDKPGDPSSGEMSTEDKEDMATAYVNTPAKLSHRFEEAMGELGDESRKLFRGGRLDHEQKRLYSRDGKFAMQWQTRFNPEAPEGQGNVQSIKGAVKIVKVKDGEAPAKGPDESAKGSQWAERDAQRKQAAKEALSERLGYKKSADDLDDLSKGIGMMVPLFNFRTMRFGPAKYLEMQKGGDPIGTRKQYGNYWYKKGADGKWLYDGVVNPGAKAPTPAQNKAAAQALQDHAVSVKVGKLQDVAAGAAQQLIKDTTRRDRMIEGQSVVYTGQGHQKYSGQRGKLVALGNKGTALIKMSDGRVIDSRWQNVKPDGVIQEHSLYDGLEDKNLFHISGEMAASVAKVMETRIGKSKVTYRKLCETFKAAGFTLTIVGGTVRDFLQGGDSKDVDFIANCSDGELQHIVKGLNPAWANTWSLNDRLGLVTIKDAGVDVDITPVHKHSDDVPSWQVKGWRLKGDAESRDFTINSLQLDPLTGVMIDATGKGLSALEGKTLEFCNPKMLPHSPRYTLRSFKFLARGYKTTPETDQHIRDNLQYVYKLKPEQKKRFLENQVVQKDGVEGMKKFKANFMKYDQGGAIWNGHFETIYQTIMRELR